MAGYEQQCASCGKYMEYSSRTSICWVCEAKREEEEEDEKKAAMEAEARAGEQQRAEAERSRRLDMFAAASEDVK